MRKPKRRKKVVTKRATQNVFSYCNPCMDKTDGDFVMIPVTKFQRDNFVSSSNVNQLLKMRYLLGKRYKNRFYVIKNPLWNDDKLGSLHDIL